MKNYLKKFIPVVIAASVIVSPIALCSTLVDFNGAFTTIASAADAGDLIVTNFGDGTCWINGFRKTGEIDKTGELVIPETIGDMTVTGISKEAFKNCTELTKISIPNTVTTIEFSAFQGCTSLETIVISDNITTMGSSVFYNTAYYNNEANWENGVLYLDNYLISTKKTVSSELVIKDGTTLMVNSAFSGNTAITKVTIPGSLSVVSENAFYNCSALTEVVLLEGVKELGKNSFWNCPKLVKIMIPASMEKFTSGAFGNTRVKELHYTGTADSWASIEFDRGENPLYSAHTLYINGEALTEAVISVPVVNAYAFYDCDALEKVTFTDSVVEIEDNAFEYCSYLKEVEIGKNIEKIGYCAFASCGRIEKVNTTMTANEWSQLDLRDWRSNPASYAGNLYINGELLENVVLSGITTIKPCTFFGIDSIKHVSIPDTVEVIGKSAFSGTSIENLTLPEGVARIEDEAFSSCDVLKSVTLPKSLTYIGLYGFEKSENIAYVNYTGTIEQWVNISFFQETSNPVYYAKSLHINGELVEDIIIENVEGVCSYAFINCESLKNIYFADGVTTIGTKAFKACANLESVNLPNTLEISGNDAFSLCFNLNKVNYRGTVDEWAMIDFFSETSNPVYFSSCLYLNDVLLENAIIKEASKIRNYTFINCDSLKTVVIGGNVEEIWTAFKGCESLTSVEIQESVTAIYGKAFIYCTALVDVQITEDGEEFGLSGEMFLGCSALEEIMLPKRVTRIGNATFKNCTALKVVYLNSEIGFVGYDAFYGCPALEVVYYESDEEAYSEINISYGNEALASAQTHYNVHGVESHYTIITVPATCTEDGSITKSCPCGYSSFTILHAADHKHVLVNQKDATCTTDGYTGDTICEACNEVFEQGTTIAACGHSGGTATCKNPAQCEKCSEYYGEALPHAYSNDTDAKCNECGFERQIDVSENDTPGNVQNSVENETPDNVQNSDKNKTDTSVQNPNGNETQGNAQNPVESETSSDVSSTNQNKVKNPSTDKPPIVAVYAIPVLALLFFSIALYSNKKKVTD